MGSFIANNKPTVQKFEDMVLMEASNVARPEVSKLTPETMRNSPVAKLGPSKSSEVTNRLKDKQKL